MKIFKNKFYVLSMCIFIMPINGYIIAEKSVLLGIVLILTQAPYLYIRIKDSYED